MRPIDAWPPVQHAGRPGYSARHYAATSGAAEDPLRVAERIAARADSARISAEAIERLTRGESPATVANWQALENVAAGAARWERLCTSFADVIAVLKGETQTPVMRRLVREARRAATVPA